MHTRIRQRSNSSPRIVTPRSVRSTLFDWLHTWPDVLQTLYARLRKHEKASRSLGLLVFDELNRDTLCTQLNWTETPQHVVTAGFLYVSCSHVMATPDTPRHMALQSAVHMRVHAVSEQTARCGVMVLVIYNVEKTQSMMRLFRVPLVSDA